VLCSVALVVGLVWFGYVQLTSHGFDWTVALGSLEHLHWGWLAASIVPIAGTYYGRALRWAVFLKPLKERPSIANLCSATVIGFAAITVFGRPGEFVRPYLIAVKERVPVPSQMAAWILERMFDLLMALFFFAFALTRVTSVRLHSGSKLIWVLAAGGRIVGVASVAVLILILSMRHVAEPVRRMILSALRFLPERQFLKTDKLITAFVRGVESTRSDGALALVLVYSVAEWFLIALCYWCLAKSFSGIINFTFVDVIVLVGFISFGGAVQIPGVGGGIQVVAVLVLTELFGVRLEIASTFAILIWILTFVVIVPAGAAMALKEGLDWRSLRQIGREASTR
jgi:uncharacterized protein (TIRG00374 family)